MKHRVGEEPGARFPSREQNGQTFLRESKRGFLVGRKGVFVDSVEESFQFCEGGGGGGGGRRRLC